MVFMLSAKPARSVRYAAAIVSVPVTSASSSATLKSSEMEKVIDNVLWEKRRQYRTLVGHHIVAACHWTSATKEIVYGLLSSRGTEKNRADAAFMGGALITAIAALDARNYFKLLAKKKGIDQAWQVALLLDCEAILPKEIFDGCRQILLPEPSMKLCLKRALECNPHPTIALLGTLTLVAYRSTMYIEEDLSQKTNRSRNPRQKVTFLRANAHMGATSGLRYIVDFAKTLTLYGEYIESYRNILKKKKDLATSPASVTRRSTTTVSSEGNIVEKTKSNEEKCYKISSTDYTTEADGYVSLLLGEKVEVLAGPEDGEDDNAWASYCYVRSQSTDREGWAPTAIFQSSFVAAEELQQYSLPEFSWQ